MVEIKSKRAWLIARSAEIRELVEAELKNIDKPMSITDLVRKVSSNRITVSRMIQECIDSGRFPHIGVVVVGGYDIIYRTHTNDISSMPVGETHQCHGDEINGDNAIETGRIEGI